MTNPKKTPAVAEDVYNSFSDDDIDLEDKRTIDNKTTVPKNSVVRNTVCPPVCLACTHTPCPQDRGAGKQGLCDDAAALWCTDMLLHDCRLQKKTAAKKPQPSSQEIKDKIAKLKLNKKRLELRKIQINARSLSLDSKLEANKADTMKLTCCADIMPASYAAAAKALANE